MQGAALGFIQQFGHASALFQNGAGQGSQRFAAQPQAWLSASFHDGQLIAQNRLGFLAAVLRAFGKQAGQQEAVQKADLRLVDSRRQERVQVQAAHFHIFHAPALEHGQRALAGLKRRLGAYGAVELVLDLQQGGAELPVFAIDFQADGLVGRVRLSERPVHGPGVGIQAVAGDVQAALGIALIAEPPHAQGGGVGQVQGRLVESLKAESRRRAGGPVVRGARRSASGGQGSSIEKGSADGRRSAEQVDQQPAVPAEVADQAEVALGDKCLIRRPAEQRRIAPPEGFGQGEVVVDAGDGLHAPAIAVAQPSSVYGLRLGDVGSAVAANGDAPLVFGDAGHGSGPEQFPVQAVMNEAVDVLELPDAGFRRAMHAGDEFQLGLGEIGGDLRMGEGRAERIGMRALRQPAVQIDPQAFLLDAPANAGQFRPGRAQGVQPGRRNSQARASGHAGCSLAAIRSRGRGRLGRRPDPPRTGRSSLGTWRSGAGPRHRRRSCPPRCPGG